MPSRRSLCLCGDYIRLVRSASVGPVKVLFAISDTGGGHRSAAVALQAALNELSNGTISSQIVDILRTSGVPVVRSFPSIYDQVSTHWLRLYDLTFQLTNGVRVVDMLSRLLYVQARKNIHRLLQETQPELVVVTHPLVHRLVCAARRSYKLPCRVVTVVTDLVSLHASWAYPGVDLCLVPTAEAYERVLRWGMRPARLLRTGFPVHPHFARYQGTPPEARRALGVAEDRFTVLITSGGVGSGNMRELVLSLRRYHPDKQLLVVTGKNRALYEQLGGLASPNLHVYGFVDNMETMMAASDIVVTKAGPGTLMEALAMRKPVLVTQAVGMQERGNIDFVLNYELGAFCPTHERLIAAVGELTDPARYQATVARLENAVPRDGAFQIADQMLAQLSMAKHGTYRTGSAPRRKFVLRLPGWRLTLTRTRRRTVRDEA
ncbi:MAG: glycosyltransferase [Chloroflexales bacterium]|nr:glycosyltransferase [Chloroflexales bacterium]